MKATKLIVDKWLNCPEDFSLDVFNNKIKIIHAFQMLCPGCVYRGIPQTIELYQKYHSENIVVVGLHCVFEHHDVMTEKALKIFISEWQLPFPVGIDKRLENQTIPETMKAYKLKGTPSMLVIDQEGFIKVHQFGHLNQEPFENFISELIKQQKSFKV